MHAFLKTLDYFVGLFSRRTMRLFPNPFLFCSQLGNIRLLFLNKKKKKVLSFSLRTLCVRLVFYSNCGFPNQVYFFCQIGLGFDFGN